MELIKAALLQSVCTALIGAGIAAAMLLIYAAVKVIKEDRKDKK